MEQIIVYLLMVQKFFNMKKTGFTGYVYDFSVDSDAIAVDDILGILKYLMKKNNIVCV